MSLRSVLARLQTLEEKERENALVIGQYKRRNDELQQENQHATEKLGLMEERLRQMESSMQDGAGYRQNTEERLRHIEGDMGDMIGTGESIIGRVINLERRTHVKESNDRFGSLESAVNNIIQDMSSGTKLLTGRLDAVVLSQTQSNDSTLIERLDVLERDVRSLRQESNKRHQSLCEKLKATRTQVEDRCNKIQKNVDSCHRLVKDKLDTTNKTVEDRCNKIQKDVDGCHQLVKDKLDTTNKTESRNHSSPVNRGMVLAALGGADAADDDDAAVATTAIAKKKKKKKKPSEQSAPSVEDVENEIIKSSHQPSSEEKAEQEDSSESRNRSSPVNRGMVLAAIGGADAADDDDAVVATTAKKKKKEKKTKKPSEQSAPSVEDVEKIKKQSTFRTYKYAFSLSGSHCRMVDNYEEEGWGCPFVNLSTGIFDVCIKGKYSFSVVERVGDNDCTLYGKYWPDPKRDWFVCCADGRREKLTHRRTVDRMLGWYEYDAVVLECEDGDKVWLEGIGVEGDVKFHVLRFYGMFKED